MTTPVAPRRVRVAGDLFHPQLPSGAVYLGRSGPGLHGSAWANPHRVGKPCQVCGGGTHDRLDAVIAYALMFSGSPARVRQLRRDLAGAAELACWCRLDQACHVDVVIELLGGRPAAAVWAELSVPRGAPVPMSRRWMG